MATIPDRGRRRLRHLPGRPRSGRRALGRRRPGVRVYEDYRELLAKEQVDLVSIVTPDNLHGAVLFAALDAGVKAVFCDKPLDSLDEADRMVTAARAAHVPLSVNYGRRWYPEYAWARRLVLPATRPAGPGAHRAGGPRAMLWRIHTHAIDLINFANPNRHGRGPTWSRAWRTTARRTAATAVGRRRSSPANTASLPRRAGSRCGADPAGAGAHHRNRRSDRVDVEAGA
jgi:hypothetical protein